MNPKCRRIGIWVPIRHSKSLRLLRPTRSAVSNTAAHQKWRELFWIVRQQSEKWQESEWGSHAHGFRAGLLRRLGAALVRQRGNDDRLLRVHVGGEWPLTLDVALAAIEIQQLTLSRAVPIAVGAVRPNRQLFPTHPLEGASPCKVPGGARARPQVAGGLQHGLVTPPARRTPLGAPADHRGFGSARDGYRGGSHYRRTSRTGRLARRASIGIVVGAVLILVASSRTRMTHPKLNMPHGPVASGASDSDRGIRRSQRVGCCRRGIWGRRKVSGWCR
jgi:hypothetical protein